jgi:hypothetical protein
MHVDQSASTAADDGVSLPDRDGLRRITAAEEAGGEARLPHLNEPAPPELPVASARRFGAPCRSGFQVFRDGIDGYQHLHRQRAILDGDAELLLDAEHQFQRVDRVEPEAAGPEQRRIIADPLDRRGEIQANGQDFPDLLLRRIRFQRVSSFFPVDEPGGNAPADNFLS